MTIKTTLIEGAGWPVFEGLPTRFKHDYVKPVRVFKNSHEKAKVTNANFDEWLSKPQPIRTRRSK